MVFKYQKNEQGLFQCQHCPFTSGPQSTMHYHLKTQHGGDLKYACKYCKSRFVQKNLLDLHVNSRHKDEVEKRQKQFKCPFPKCETQDLRKGNIISHFCRVHLRDLVEKAFVPADAKKKTEMSCATCKKEFASKPSFNYHIYTCIQPSKDHSAYQWYQDLESLEAETV
jgi:hypothetical protein